MGLFDFLKPKKKPIEIFEKKMMNSMFPNGEKDIDAGTKELLQILDNQVNYETARDIFVKSAAISRISEKFDKERLRIHLSGYCLHHFNEQHIAKFYNYLTALGAAMLMNGSSPSEVKRKGNDYVW